MVTQKKVSWMTSNGSRSRTKTELTEYQRRIASIENVILCIAEAERMIAQIGSELRRTKDREEAASQPKSRMKQPPRIGQRGFFQKCSVGWWIRDSHRENR